LAPGVHRPDSGSEGPAGAKLVRGVRGGHARRLLGGPAFGWCNLRLCTNQSVELFLGADIHPADDARHAGVQAVLLQTGNQAAAGRIDARWQELVALSGQSPPPEYELTYPKDLMDEVAAARFAAAKGMGMTPWSGGPAGANFHIGAILNNAWESFLSEPATFAAFEKQQIEAIRARHSQGSP
jgi:hypothetical protein